MKKYELVVIGGGPAGMAVAFSAMQEGVKSILLLERQPRLGGILNQCIHEGFGLHYYKKELTGTEYAVRYRRMLEHTCIEIKTSSFVTRVSKDKKVSFINSEGVHIVQGSHIVLATGCRERTREMLTVPGTRPAGVFTAGLAQEMVNIYGVLPGKKVVIIGSGDIGLIMARRMTLEGAEVLCVLEIQENLSGLVRNKIQCLDDFGIPLYCNHELIEIYGKNRVEAIRYRDKGRRTEDKGLGDKKILECDTLLFSVGLISEIDLLTTENISPENGFYLAGNAHHVHELADDATKSAEELGKQIAIASLPRSLSPF